MAIEIGGRRYVVSCDDATVVEEIGRELLGGISDCSFRWPDYSWKLTVMCSDGRAIREEEPYSSVVERLAEVERLLEQALRGFEVKEDES